MIENEVMSGIEAALLTAAAREAAEHTVTITSSTPYTVTLDTMPDTDEDWYIGAVLELREGIASPGQRNIARVIRSADVDLKTLTWGRNVETSFSFPATARLTSKPLSGASVLMHDSGQKEYNVTVVTLSGEEMPIGLGPIWQVNTGGMLLIESYPEIPDDVVSSSTYRSKYRDFWYFIGQVREIVSEHCLDSCWRVLLGRWEFYIGSQPDLCYRVEQKWGVKRVRS